MPSVLVTVSPHPSTSPRVRELLTWVTNEIRQHEPSVTQYATYEAPANQEGTVDFLVHFKISDITALAKRRELPHHQTIAKAIKDEDLLRKPLEYKALKDVGGWKR